MSEGNQVLIYDRLPIGGEDFFSFRMGKFNYLYLCKACTRSFETVDPTNKCIFCGTTGNLKELVAKKSKKRSKKNYLYHCEKCDRTFETQKETDVCQFCGCVNIDYYTGMPSGRIGSKDKLFSKIFSLFSHFDKVKLIARPGKIKKTLKASKTRFNTKAIKQTISRFSFRLASRKQEELPTR